jgi:hypothetical protein
MNYKNNKNDEKEDTIYFNLENKNLKIKNENLQKMAFIYNALEDGWEIKKNGEKYIFIKKHNGKKEYIHENYLNRFIEQNFNIEKLDLFIKNN